MEEQVSSIPTTDIHAFLNNLDERIVKVWRIKGALFCGFVFLSIAVFEVVFALAGRSILFPGFLTLAVAGLGILGTLLIPSLAYRYWSYEMGTQELLLQRGIINHVRTVVPLRRVQHLDVSQDIIEKEFELGKLIVHTAGSRSEDVVLPGLGIQVAERLRDELKNYIREDTL